MANTVRVFFSDTPKFEGYELSTFVNDKAEVVVKIEGNDVDFPYNETLIPLDTDTARAFVKELNRIIKQAENDRI